MAVARYVRRHLIRFCSFATATLNMAPSRARCTKKSHLRLQISPAIRVLHGRSMVIIGDHPVALTRLTNAASPSFMYS